MALNSLQQKLQNVLTLYKTKRLTSVRCILNVESKNIAISKYLYTKLHKKIYMLWIVWNRKTDKFKTTIWNVFRLKYANDSAMVDITKL